MSWNPFPWTVEAFGHPVVDVPGRGFVPADLSSNANRILAERYLLADGVDSEGTKNLIETPDGMFHRVADAIAKAERMYGADDDDVRRHAESFYQAMASLDFLPNSPTLMNAGTEQGTLSACFVLPLHDTMEDITGASHAQAMVQKFGGGTGFALSDLRPKGTPISTTHGSACGPVATLRFLSATSDLVTQGGKRDGANMAVLDVHHPDIEEFISCKKNEGDIRNFNISVGVTNEFMHAVANGTDYPLRFRWDPADAGSEVVETRRLDAGALFKTIVESAWRNGEPGMVFLDEVNRNNPVAHLGDITATNPCGEQPLLPNESCNLGSINLSHFVLGKPADGVVLRDSAERAALLNWESGSPDDDLPRIDWDRL